MRRSTCISISVVCALLTSACAMENDPSAVTLEGAEPSASDEGYVLPRYEEPGSDDELCPDEQTISVRITSGEDTEVGTAVLRLDGAHLRLVLEARHGFELGAAQAWITQEAFSSVFSSDESASGEYGDRVHLAIPIEEAGLVCGDVFKLVLSLPVRDTLTWTRRFAEAVGPIQLDSPENFDTFHHTICCPPPPPPPPPPDGCTLTQGYWKNHLDWPVDSLEIGGQPYTQAELLPILESESEGDASIILGRQLIAALLNVENGASPIAAIGDAQTWMSGFAGKLPFDVDPSSASGQEATALADALAAYNEGVTGPGHCDSRRSSSASSIP